MVWLPGWANGMGPLSSPVIRETFDVRSFPKPVGPPAITAATPARSMWSRARSRGSGRERRLERKPSLTPRALTLSGVRAREKEKPAARIQVSPVSEQWRGGSSPLTRAGNAARRGPGTRSRWLCWRPTPAGGPTCAWLEGAEINQDRHLRLQYLAGMGVNQNQGGQTYQEMLSHRTFPDALFTGSPRRKTVLERRAQRPDLEFDPTGAEE